MNLKRDKEFALESGRCSMKVLITTDWYRPVVNGVVASVLNLREELTKRGHEVRILTLSPTMRSYEKDGVIYIASLKAGLIYPQARVRRTTAHRYIKRILQWKPDVVHSQCEFSTFHFGRRIANELNIPLIHTYHTVYEDYTHYFCPNKKLGRKIVASFSKRVLHKTDYVVVPSKKVAELLTGYRVQTPVCVVPTGIKLHKFSDAPSKEWISAQKKRLGIPEDHFVLIYIGRLAKEKKLEEVISYIPDLKDEKVTLLIVGDGPHRPEIEKAVQQYHVENQVKFAGMVSPQEVGQFYHLGDLFVNASTSETQGLTYFEALAAGVPVLCRKDKCLDGIVENGISGWQYDTREDFLSRIVLFKANEVMREKMSKKALQVAERFSTTAFADEIEGLYLRLTS